MRKRLNCLPAAARLARFAAARDGAVALIFGLAMVPLVLAMGAAADFAKFSVARSQAQKAVDSASLAGASAAAATLRAGGTASAASAAGDNAAKVSFAANVASLGPVMLTNFTPGATVTASSAAYQSAATLVYTPLFMKIAGFTQIPFTVRSTANTASSHQYIDVYVLADASQSMGLGASAVDQANMTGDPAIGCALACHNGHATHPTNPSSVTTARNKGYKLRFDVVRDALAAIVNQAQTLSAGGDITIRFGVYTFATQFKTEIDLSATFGSSATPNSILHAVSAMDIADASAGTSIKHALDQLKLKIGAVGAGTAAAAPKVFVLLLTDGVGNATDNKATVSPSDAYDWTYSTTIFPAFSGGTCWPQLPPGDGSAALAPAATPLAPPCVPDPWVAPSHTGNGQMELNGVDPAWCAPIKGMGATVMTLYTTYVPVDSDYDWRTAYLKRAIIPSIPDHMKACASTPADAFVANDAAQVSNAITQMFARATSYSPVRLTR